MLPVVFATLFPLDPVAEAVGLAEGAGAGVPGFAAAEVEASPALIEIGTAPSASTMAIAPARLAEVTEPSMTFPSNFRAR